MSLNDSHVMVTGVTGFVGQALLERLLACYPDCRVTVLVRPQEGATAEERLVRLLRKPVFDPLREAIGDDALAATARRRVTVIPGDLTTLPVPPSSLDVILHAASNVSFDAPIDEAFADNVGGPMAMYRSLRNSAADPHVVHVSTSYVAGLRRGVAEEASLAHAIDFEAELEHANRARARSEELSRTPEVLQRLVCDAEKEHGRAGPQVVAEAAETARLDWVRRRLVDHGRARARSLGWADAYTLSKALGERVAERLWAGAGHRLSVVRPTIIESAMHHPFPGWIDGFKVADPIIAAYARGALPVFPGNADTVVDIIPVDFVVNAILAAASAPPKPNEVNYFQVGSGMSNPLSFGHLADLCTEHFTDHPLPDASSAVAKWTFPHSWAVKREMRRREFAVKAADSVVGQLPSTRRTRQWSATLLKTRRDLGMLRQLMSMYQPYAEFDVIFDDAETRRLYRRIAPGSRLGGFDVTDIDWRRYMLDVHLPQLPALMDHRKHRSTSELAELPRRDDVLAVFDLHSIIAATSIVRQHLWVELARKPAVRWPLSLANMLARSPQYLMADRRDPADFIRLLMRAYAGCAEHDVRRIITETVAPTLRRGMFARAVERIEAHRQAGHHTVLVTGQIDVFVEPLAPLFDGVVAGSMDVDGEGRWTGYLAAAPVVSEARAAWLRRYARDRSMVLDSSYAYGESYADRPWLEAVGFPNAVNPDLKLHRHARLRRWPIHSWEAPERRNAVTA